MRRLDSKLFLLDFGAVKQVTNAPATSSTGIYSMGFAPPEQMSGNQVFPSTDLYALAVTILTLLTGQEATKLFDGYSNQWQWRTQASINPRLADILDKMLLPAANQRFQSAQEVLDRLKEIYTPQLIPATHIPPTSSPARQSSSAAVSPLPSATPAFSTWELLGGAAFSGFQGALIAIAIFSLLQNPIITLGISFVILGILIFAQSFVILGILIFAQARRWIEKFDLLIIPAISFTIIFFIPVLHGDLGIQQVLILAVAAALVSIALTALFRLIYKLLSLIL